MSLQNVFDFIKNLNRRKKIILAVCLVILGALTYRSCTRSLVSSHVFRIARPSDWNFLELTGKERNLQAFTDDLLLMIAKAQDLRIEIFSVSDRSLVRALDTELYDGIVSSLLPDPINTRRYIFSDPFYLYGQVLIVRGDSSISALNQLQKKKVGIRRGIFASHIPDVYGTVLTPYDNVGNALSDLDRGLLDGVLLDAWSAYVYAQGYYKGRIKVVSAPLTKEGLRLITLKGFIASEWVEAFNEQLQIFKEDGTYASLLEKWGIYNTMQEGSAP